MTPIAPPQQSTGRPTELAEGKTQIPSGWTIRTLGEPDISTILMGQSPLSSTYNRTRRGLPFFQGKTDFGQRFPTPRVWCSAPVRVAEPADVLVSVRAPVGAANLALETCCIGRGVAAVRPGPATTSEFLFYWFVHNEERLDAMGSGAIFRAINKHVLASAPILLPPLSEQRAIATLLSALNRRSELEASRLASLRTLKAATMAKMFDVSSSGQLVHDPPPGLSLQGWRAVRVEDLGEIVTGTTPSTRRPDFYDGPIPFISPGDLGDHRLIRRTQKALTEAGANASRPLPSGTVLVVCIGSTIGKVGTTSADLSCTNQQINAIIPNPDIASDFVHYLMEANAEQIRSSSSRGPVPMLTKGLFSKIAIAIPESRCQQNVITMTLTAIDDAIEVSMATLLRMSTLFDQLLRSLMSGAIRLSRSSDG